MKNGYLVITGRIEKELASIEKVFKRTILIWNKGAIIGDDMYIDATALNLQSLYTGIEKIFCIIAEGIDSYKPNSFSWHKSLIHQMGSEIKDVRPKVISNELVDALNPYLGFRHVVRNVYTYTLDPDQIQLLVNKLEYVINQLKKKLSVFMNFLEKI